MSGGMVPTTADERAVLRARHSEKTWTSSDSNNTYRDYQGGAEESWHVWPCPTARLLADYDRQAARIVEIEREIERLAGDNDERHHIILSMMANGLDGLAAQSSAIAREYWLNRSREDE